MKIGVVGCMGRVGQILVNELRSGNWDDLEFAGGTALPEDLAKAGDDYFVTDKPAELFDVADAVIDFTAPAATVQHAKHAATYKTALIVGTTGLSADDEAALKEAAEKTTIVYAANFSIGVNVLLALVEQAAARLKDGWDIEVFESHHKHKVDAPSGTALAIGKAAAAGRDVDLNKVADWARNGETGARKEGHIGFSVARGGDVVGDHTAFFYGEGERLELTHKATNRALFARGAIHAARWALSQETGLYSMKDVLDL
ncbi:MAG: 4-hydroxy-tetrahydrodipicolinate reductase [Alphaproteobacteria bacterium]|nr:4-hydroxy-tetrahydrodipicolinate reductase [Alphaproteobacteria bacterium]